MSDIKHADSKPDSSACAAEIAYLPQHHKRKITWVVGLSIFVLGAFLITVSVTSYYGLKRFQNSLSVITDESLPRVFRSSQTITQLSSLLVSAEQLVNVSSSAERRIAYSNMSQQLDEIIVGLMDMGPEESAMSGQLAALIEYLDQLNALMSQKIWINQSLVDLSDKLPEVLKMLPVFPPGQRFGNYSGMQLNQLLASFSLTISDWRFYALGGSNSTPAQLTRSANQTFSDMKRVFAGVSGVEAQLVRNCMS